MKEIAELEKLNEMYEKGLISQEDFDILKDRIIKGGSQDDVSKGDISVATNRAINKKSAIIVIASFISLTSIGLVLWNIPSFIPNNRSVDSFALALEETIEKDLSSRVTYSQISDAFSSEEELNLLSVYTPDVLETINQSLPENIVSFKSKEGSGNLTRITYSVLSPYVTAFEDGSMKRLQTMQILSNSQINTYINTSTIKFKESDFTVEVEECGFLQWCIKDEEAFNNMKYANLATIYFDIKEVTEDFNDTVYTIKDVDAIYATYELANTREIYNRVASDLNRSVITLDLFEEGLFEAAKKKWVGIADLMKFRISLNEVVIPYREIIVKEGGYSNIRDVTFSTVTSLHDLAEGKAPRDYNKFKAYYIEHDWDYSPKGIKAWGELTNALACEIRIGGC